MKDLIEIKRFLKPIHEKLSEEGWQVRVYLFGSRAKGTAKENSDLDVLIVSDAFSGLSKYLCRKMTESFLTGERFVLDAFCMTESEFEVYKKSEAFENDAPRLLGDWEE